MEDIYLHSSALSAVREYNCSLKEKELWAFLCATYDFMKPVRTIYLPMLRGLVRKLSEKQLSITQLIQAGTSEQKEVLKTIVWVTGRGTVIEGWKHIGRGEGFMCLLESLKQFLENHETIGKFVYNVYKANSDAPEPVEAVMRKLVETLHSYNCPNYCQEKVKTRGECRRYKLYLPDPNGNSALKRLCLYFRWMVRPYPDLNQWKFIPPSKLYLSVDRGVKRVLERLGIMKNSLSTPTWSDVLEVTGYFRDLNPEDPARYDFLISRLAILGICPVDYDKTKCNVCWIREYCPSKRETEIKTKPLRDTEKRILQKFIEEDILEGNYEIEVRVDNKRIDAVCKTASQDWVLEIERNLNYAALGQVLTYQELYTKETGKTVKAGIVCVTKDIDVLEACKATNVELFEVSLNSFNR